MFVVTSPPATIRGRRSNRSALMMMLQGTQGCIRQGCIRHGDQAWDHGFTPLRSPTHSWFHMAAARLCSCSGVPCTRQAGMAAPSASSTAASRVCSGTAEQCVRWRSAGGALAVRQKRAEGRRQEKKAGGRRRRPAAGLRDRHEPHPGRHGTTTQSEPRAGARRELARTVTPARGLQCGAWRYHDAVSGSGSSSAAPDGAPVARKGSRTPVGRCRPPLGVCQPTAMRSWPGSAEAAWRKGPCWELPSPGAPPPRFGSAAWQRAAGSHQASMMVPHESLTVTTRNRVVAACPQTGSPGMKR